ncbi:MAG: hypothetical protein KIH62_000265 [Candidatus Kerfeldbacteria bacterium]|nr:hypothetical protein [Candidatus Kerfeldbacteria bacterium]
MNEQLFNRLPGGENGVERYEGEASEFLDDAQVEGGVAYAAHVIAELRRREGGVQEETIRRVDELARSVGLDPLKMREVLEAIGAADALNRAHTRMRDEIDGLEDDLRRMN